MLGMTGAWRFCPIQGKLEVWPKILSFLSKDSLDIFSCLLAFTRLESSSREVKIDLLTDVWMNANWIDATMAGIEKPTLCS